MLYRFDKNQTLAWGDAPFSIQAIAQDVNQLIYSHAFHDNRFASGLKERRTHGMAHVSRAALIGAAGYNLMASLDIEGFDALGTEARAEELKLVQIALLLHDSGCESDAKDTHDKDSALNLYYYLTERLGVLPEKAKIVAEAMRNKDWMSGEPYSELTITPSVRFEDRYPPTDENPFETEVNRLRLAIQFGDSIDYQRTRKKFRKERLQLYNRQYADPGINQHIRKVSEVILKEDLILTENFRLEMNRRNVAGVDCNGDQAFEFALKDMQEKAPMLTSLYQDGRVLALDDELLLQYNNKGKPFYYKTLRADEACFWPDFIYNLIDGAPSELRPRERQAYTSRIGKNQQYEIVPTHKKHPERTPLFTLEQKAQTTPAQSMSYANPVTDYFPSAFGHDRRNLLVGISTPVSEAEGIYTRRISMYDSGTIARTFEGKTVRGLERDVEHKLARNIYHTTLESLEKAGMTDQEKHNEIMARIKWVENNDDYKILIFSDNLESRILAQARALDMHYAVVERRKKQGLPFDGSYRPKIVFYPVLSEYTQLEQQSDLKVDQSILGKAIQSLLNNKPLSTDEKCDYFMQEGKNLSRNFNQKILGSSLLLLFGKYLTDRDTYRNSFEVALDALPAQDMIDILIHPENPLNGVVTVFVLNDKARLGRLLFRMNPNDWEAFLRSPDFSEKIVMAMEFSADLMKVFLKIPKPLWGKLLSLKPFSDLINQVDSKGLTPLGYACDEEVYEVLKLEMIEALLKQGATASTRTPNGNTPLSIACARGDQEIVEHCLNNGVNFMEENALHQTPLEICLKNNQIELAMFILEKYKDINAQSSQGLTPIHLAARYGSEELLMILISRKADLNLQDGDGMSALDYATENKHLKVVKKLIDAGADINSIDSKKTPLFAKIIANTDERFAIALLPKVKNIDSTDADGLTLLALAIYYRRYELAKKLIEMGAELNTMDTFNRSPFHRVCEQGDIQLFEIFIKKGGDVNMAVPQEDSTPLMLAASRGHLALVKKLIELKANLSVENYLGETALSLSIREGYREIAETLLEAGADPNPTRLSERFSPLVLAVWNDDLGLVTKLLDHGANIDLSNSDGVSPLHRACNQGLTECVKLLLEKGANPFVRDTKGKMPFDYLLGDSANKQYHELAIEFIRMKPEALTKIPSILDKFPSRYWPELLAMMDQSELLNIMADIDKVIEIIKSLDDVHYMSILNKLGPEYFQKRLHGLVSLLLFLCEISEVNRLPFLKMLGQDFLQSLITDRFTLCSVLENLPMTARVDFLDHLPQPMLQSLIHSKFDWEELKNHIPPDAHAYVHELLGGNLFKKKWIDHYLTLKEILQSSENPAAILSELEVDHLRSLLTLPTYLEESLNYLPAPSRFDFLNKLGADHLKMLYTKDSYGFDVLLNLFESHDRLTVVNFLGADYLVSKTQQLFNLVEILQTLPEQDRQACVIDLEIEGLKRLMTYADDLKNFLAAFSGSFKPNLIALLGVPFLKDTLTYAGNRALDIKNGAELGLILRALPKNDRFDFLKIIKSEALSRILPDGKHLYVMLTKIPIEDRADLMQDLNAVMRKDVIDKLIDNSDRQVQAMLKDVLPSTSVSPPKNI